MPLRSRPIFASLLLPLTLGVTLPAVQWCPVDWEDVRVECMFLDCASPAPSTCAAAAPDCGQAMGCHSANDERCAGSAACSERGRDATTPERPDSPPRHRAYCLDETAGGPAVRTSHAPIPSTVFAVLGAASPADHEAPNIFERRRPEPEARPPTLDWTTAAPTRAPPCESLT